MVNKRIRTYVHARFNIAELQMPESNDRLTDLGQFYEILHRLDKTIGGSHRLTECSGKMPWPSHGVYFFFEDGEVRSDSGVGPRVVRVGTHALTATSRTTLWNRLSQHRGVTKTGAGNHRGSIFRLIVGEALSKKTPSFGVETWGQGQSAIAAVRATEVEHERRVSDYIRAMPFVWLRVSDDGGGPALRALIERNSIALLSNYEREPLDLPSPYWLGRHSPRIKVNKSGLWNQNHVDEPYDRRFLSEMDRLVSGD